MNKDWIEKAERYLDNEMSKEERSLFEKEMAANEELLSYVTLYKEIETVMQQEEVRGEEQTELKGSLEKLNQAYFTAPASPTLAKKRHPLKKIMFRRLLLIAAAAAGILTIGILWYGQRDDESSKLVSTGPPEDSIVNITTKDSGQAPNLPPPAITQADNDTTTAKNETATSPSIKEQQALFADNFVPDSIPAITEGPLEEAFFLYREKEYADAAEEFSTTDVNLITRGATTDSLTNAFYAGYYSGISYLAGKETSKAVAQLQSALTKTTDSLFYIKTQWYLALAFLRAGEINKTKELLAKISASNADTGYKAKATHLQRQMKQQ